MSLIQKQKFKIAVLFMTMISLLTVSLSAWFDTSQHKTNQLTLQDGVGMVIMTKYGVHEDGTVLSTGLKDVDFEIYKVANGQEVKLGMTLTTDSSGVIKVDGLTSGEYYFKELSPPPGYEFDKDDQGEPIIKHPFTINTEQEHGLIQMQIKNIRSEGSFDIEKKVLMNESSKPEDHQNKHFEFKVFFGDLVNDSSIEDNTKYPYTLSDGTKHQVSNGGTIKLKASQKASFNTIPYGTPYRVEEIPQDGYIISSNYSSGVHLNSSHVMFNNLVASDETGMVVISKNVKALGDNLLAGDSLEKLFDFEIIFEDGGEYNAKFADDKSIKVKSGDIVQLKHGDVLTLYDLPFGLKYTISEKNYESEGYWSEIGSVKGDVGNNSKPIHYLFNNIYDGGNGIPDGELGLLSLTKEVINPYHVDHEFEFKLSFDQDFPGTYQIGTGDILPFENGMKIQIRNLQELKINGVPFGARYVIEEIAKKDYIMLSEKYEGIVMDENVSIKAFNNYDGPETREGYLEILKTVVGPKSDRSFDFELHVNGEIIEFSLKDGEMASYTFEKGTQYAVYEKDYRDDGYVLSLTNGQGTIEKGKNIEVMATNTYDASLHKLTIKGEKTWDLKGNSTSLLPESITLDLYDSNDNLLDTFKVNADDKGKWNYEIKVPKYDSSQQEIDYTIRERNIPGFLAEYDGFNIKNTYYGFYEYRPIVEKGIDGKSKPKEASNFIFDIQALNGAPTPHTTQVTITGEGTVNFDVIRFEKAGTYQYVLSEREVRDGDYQYDTIPVLLTLKLEYTQEGLKATSIVYEKNGVEADKAQFINTYLGVEESPDPENPGTEEPGTEVPKPEKPGTEVPNPENPGTEEPKPESPGTPKPNKPGGNGSEIGDLPLPHTGVENQQMGAKACLVIALGLALILYNLKKKNEGVLNYEKNRKV